MRLFRMGLVAAFVLAFAGQAMAADAPKITPDQRTQGKKEAPAVIQRLGLDCQVDDAAFIGNNEEKIEGKTVKSAYYEVACHNNLGYLLASEPAPGKDQFFDCVTMRTQADQILAKGKPAQPPTVCTLPGNAKSEQGFSGVLAKAGFTCAPTKARYLGSNVADQFTIYETRCDDGHSYLVTLPNPGSKHALAVNDCVEAAIFGTKCQFITDDELSKQIITLAQPKNPATCQPTGARWLTTTVDTDRYFEIGCADGKSGYVFEATTKGEIKRVVGCAGAQQMAGGCTLSNVDVARTEQAGLYTQLIVKAGYPCGVSKYQTLGPETAAPHREVVEIACKESSGSMWSFIPTEDTGQAVVVNCLRSQVYGLPSCKLTPMSGAYADLGAQVASKGQTCSVTNARYITGVRSPQGDDFVEVSCAGGTGFVIGYTPAPIETVRNVYTCKDAAGTTRACTLK